MRQPGRRAFQRRAEIRHEVRAGRVPLVRRLRDCFRKDGVHLGRQLVPHFGHRRRVVPHVRPQHGDLGLSPEECEPREALEGDAAERVHVGPSVHIPSLDLLRRHVVDRPDELS